MSFRQTPSLSGIDRRILPIKSRIEFLLMALDLYLAGLRSLPFVRAVGLSSDHPRTTDGAVLLLAFNERYVLPFVLLEELDLEKARAWTHQASAVPGLLLLMPRVSDAVGAILAVGEINFMDLQGNVSLHLHGCLLTSRRVPQTLS